MYRFKLWQSESLSDQKNYKCCHGNCCQQRLPDTHQKLISSESFSGKHFLKIWGKFLHWLGLWKTQKSEKSVAKATVVPGYWPKPNQLWILCWLTCPESLVEIAACHHYPDGAGYDYNPSLGGLGLKMNIKAILWGNRSISTGIYRTLVGLHIYSALGYLWINSKVQQKTVLEPEKRKVGRVFIRPLNLNVWGNPLGGVGIY